MNPDLGLALERVVRAPRDVVWDASTDPSRLERWWSGSDGVPRRPPRRPARRRVRDADERGRGAVRPAHGRDHPRRQRPGTDRVHERDRQRLAPRDFRPGPHDGRDHADRSSGRHRLSRRRRARRSGRPRPSRRGAWHPTTVLRGDPVRTVGRSGRVRDGSSRSTAARGSAAPCWRPASSTRSGSSSRRPSPVPGGGCSTTRADPSASDSSTAR